MTCPKLVASSMVDLSQILFSTRVGRIEASKIPVFVHFSALLFWREFSGQFFGNSGLLRQGGQAR